MKTKVNIIAGSLLGGVFIWLAFRGTDLQALRSSFRSADYRYLIPVALMSFTVQLIRSYRWGVILEPLKKIDQWSLFSVTSVGFMAISLLPVRMGEFARPYLISRKSGIKLGASLATIVVERVFDMLTLMIVLLTIIMVIELPSWIFRSACVMLFITIPLLLLLIFVAVKRDISVKGVDRIISRLPHSLSGRLMRLFHSFLDGLQVLPSFRKTAYLTFLSLTTWSLIGLVTYVLFSSFASMEHLPLAAAFTVLVITALGITLPTAPGFIGNYHFSCVLGLTLFGISKTDALTYAILLHGIQFSIVVGLGLIFIPFIKVPLPDLFKSSPGQ